MFNERFTERQREAVARAYVDRHVRPARAVADLARRGELESANGERLAAFEIGESTIRSFAGNLRRRRRGEIKSNLATARPTDAVEALRQRLVNAADAGLASLERRQRRERGKTDWTELREVARAVREIAALPAPGERGVEPGQRAPGSGARAGGSSRGGLAGRLLAAHRASPPTSNGAGPGAPAGSARAQTEDHARETDDELLAEYRRQFGAGGETA
jgi:hypothetical protein